MTNGCLGASLTSKKPVRVLQPAHIPPDDGCDEITASWLDSRALASVLAEQVCGDGHGQVGDVVVPQISASLSVWRFSKFC